MVLSLPGNPFAALAALAVIGTPLLACMNGSRARLQWQPAKSDFTLDRTAGRTELFPAKLIGFDPGGAPLLDRLGKGGSARLAPLVAADGLWADRGGGVEHNTGIGTSVCTMLCAVRLTGRSNKSPRTESADASIRRAN